MPRANLYVWSIMCSRPVTFCTGYDGALSHRENVFGITGCKIVQWRPQIVGKLEFLCWAPKKKKEFFSFRLQKSVSSLLKYFMRDVTSSLKRWCNSAAGMTLCHDPPVLYFWNMSASKLALSEYLLRTKSIRLDRRRFLLNSSHFIGALNMCVALNGDAVFDFVLLNLGSVSNLCTAAWIARNSIRKSSLQIIHLSFSPASNKERFQLVLGIGFHSASSSLWWNQEAT